MYLGSGKIEKSYTSYKKVNQQLIVCKEEEPFILTDLITNIKFHENLTNGYYVQKSKVISVEDVKKYLRGFSSSREVNRYTVQLDKLKRVINRLYNEYQNDLLNNTLKKSPTPDEEVNQLLLNLRNKKFTQ